jgi:hypothetical protein
MLLSDHELGDFEINPNTPSDFRSLLVTSNRLFYDSLTKQNLMHAIFAVHKAMMRAVFLLEKYSGVLPPDLAPPKKK